VESVETEVAIIGAGLAGLTAARALVADGVDVAVVEARDRVGGRTLNEPIGEGEVVELGGQWVGPTQNRVLSLIRELGLKTFPTYAHGLNLTERGGKVSRYRGTIPKANPVVLAEVGLAMRKIDRLAAKVDPGRPWESEVAGLDRMTFDSWMRRQVRTAGGRDMMRLVIEAVWAAEPEDVSMLHVLFYVRSAGSLDLLLDAEGGAQDSRVVGGTQLISRRMADALDGSIHLDSPVRRVLWSGERLLVLADGLEVSAGRVIVAIPPVLSGRIAWEPALASGRDGLTQRMVQGSVIKTMTIYGEPFWRDQGFSGQATSADGPVSVVFDNSPPGGRPGVLLAFLEGRAARDAARLSREQRRNVVSACLARLFGERAGRPDGYVEKLWAEDEWSRGCYGGYMPPGAWTSHGHALRPAVGPIHWAGAETATEWAGYMEGAIQSGERAAEEILAIRGRVAA
jgi:monoamine oxidase